MQALGLAWGRYVPVTTHLWTRSCSSASTFEYVNERTAGKRKKNERATIQCLMDKNRKAGRAEELLPSALSARARYREEMEQGQQVMRGARMKRRLLDSSPYASHLAIQSAKSGG